MDIKSVLNRLLKIAVSNGVEKAIRIHIAKGDDLNARDDAGNTPLMIAAKKNQPKACRLLLENGASPLLLDSNGNNAATIAFEAGLNDIALMIESFIPLSFTSEEEPQTKNLFPKIVVEDLTQETEPAPPASVPFEIEFESELNI